MIKQNRGRQSQLSTLLKEPTNGLEEKSQTKNQTPQCLSKLQTLIFFFSIIFITILIYFFQVDGSNKQLLIQDGVPRRQQQISIPSENTQQQKINQSVPQQELNDENKGQNKFLDHVTNLGQLYNFSQEGEIHEATYFSKPKQSLLTDHTSENTRMKSQVTVVITTSGDSKYLRSTLNSFFKFNSFPIAKVLVIKDGPINEQIKKLKEIYPNITWLITKKKIGQLAAIDVAYSFLQTQYYFHLEDDWAFMKPGFIQFSLEIYSTLPNVSNVWLFKLASLSENKHPKWKIVTYRENSYSGYNFNPSLHLTKDYTIWPGGFSNLTYFASFGLGAGHAQLAISMSYIMMGKYTVLANDDYIRHIGQTNQGGQKLKLQSAKESGRIKKLNQLTEKYEKWVKLETERNYIKRSS